MEAGHLGGYVPGGDVATHFPDLWRWLVEQHGIRTVVDVGCGDGQAVDYFLSLGCEVVGIEGVQQNHQSIIVHDYETGPWTPAMPPYRFDLAWSCEFVEHVEERFAPNFLATFACANWVMMTHAGPGAGGWHHVNCKTSDYWKGALAAIGYEFDEALTDLTRTLAAANTSPWNHYRRSGMVFRRYDWLASGVAGD